MGPARLMSSARQMHTPTPNHSSVVCVAHPCKHASHISEALAHSRHWIVAVDLIFEINKSVVFDRNESFEDLSHRHHTVSDCDLAFFVLKVCQILHVDVVQARPHFVNGFHDV